MITLTILQLVSLLSATPVATIHTQTEGLELINPTERSDQINQQLKDLLDHCSRPQKELLDLNQVLSGSYNGLLVGDYSEILNENLDLSPSLLLVDRCDNTCKDITGMTCASQEGTTVGRVLYFQDQQDKYHKLSVNEHTKCQCTMDYDLIHNVSASNERS